MKKFICMIFTIATIGITATYTVPMATGGFYSTGIVTVWTIEGSEDYHRHECQIPGEKTSANLKDVFGDYQPCPECNPPILIWDDKSGGYVAELDPDRRNDQSEDNLIQVEDDETANEEVLVPPTEETDDAEPAEATEDSRSIQRGQGDYFVDFATVAIVLIYTIILYGAGPLVFSKVRKNQITRGRVTAFSVVYSLCAWLISNIFWLLPVGGSISTGGVAIFWGAIFCKALKANLRNRGLLREQEPVSVPESDVPTAQHIVQEQNSFTINRETAKPKWILLIILCIIAAIAAGTCLWLRTESKVDISKIANSVLYLEIFDENDEIIGSASGFLVNDRNTLVTNYHVVQDACHIVAWTADGTQSAGVSCILAYDEIADLAILGCDTEVMAEPLIIGDSETVRQGDKIYAVGYPLGLANTMSDGIVSSRYLDGYGTDIIQVTAAISHGNSGGPLLDTNGRVIGVMCASYIYGQNLNVAIASDTLEILFESGFQKINLKDWDNRPEMPGYELGEEN